MEYHRKQAKELVRAHRAGEREATRRAMAVLGSRASERFLLSDAQYVVAREQGFRTLAGAASVTRRVVGVDRGRGRRDRDRPQLRSDRAGRRLRAAARLDDSALPVPGVGRAEAKLQGAELGVRSTRTLGRIVAELLGDHDVEVDPSARAPQPRGRPAPNGVRRRVETRLADARDHRVPDRHRHAVRGPSGSDELYDRSQVIEFTLDGPRERPRGGADRACRRTPRHVHPDPLPRLEARSPSAVPDVRGRRRGCARPMPPRDAGHRRA